MALLYTGRRVKKLAARLRADYEEALSREREARSTLEEENRTLKARVLELEAEKQDAIASIAEVSREQARLRAEAQKEEENGKNELLLLADKCRHLSRRLSRKYPDEEDVSDFAAFENMLMKELGAEEEAGIDMDEVLSPKQPLDLGKLCKDLGLMEDDDEV